MESPKTYSLDFTTLYLYTSLTAGSSHIITATSRMETILKANRIPFQAIDVATDEKARMLWGRRSKGRKLPGLVKGGEILGDLEAVEEWNEYGELKQVLAPKSNTKAAAAAPASTPSASTTSSPAPTASTASPTQQSKSPAASSKESESSKDTAKEDPHHSIQATIKSLGAEAAAKAKEAVKKSMTGSLLPSPPDPTGNPLLIPLPDEDKEKTLDNATAVVPPPSTVASAEASKEPNTSDAKEIEHVETVEPAKTGKVLQEVAERPTPDEHPTDAAKVLGEESASKPAESTETESSTTTEKSGSVALPIRSAGASVDDNHEASLSPRSVGSDSAAAVSSSSLPLVDRSVTQRHRGSSISQASKEEIEAIEQAARIDEVPEPEDDGIAAPAQEKPQEQKVDDTEV